MHTQTENRQHQPRGAQEPRDHRMDEQSIAALLQELADQMTTLSLFNDQAAWDALRDRAAAAAKELSA